MSEKRNPDRIRSLVQHYYGSIAQGRKAGCGCTSEPTCCGEQRSNPSCGQNNALGYSPQELAQAPEGANLGLGCGNPQAIAALKPGETVLDLGSGAGFDCFLAAKSVGGAGQVIGVDMTPEMVRKARENTGSAGIDNVEFRLGEIEYLPVADRSVDVIISNCVINLSPDKSQVFRDAFRVLKPGGRLAISDVVATDGFPDHFRENEALIPGCIGGAEHPDSLKQMLAAAGFTDISVRIRPQSRAAIREWAPGLGIENAIVSATIEAVKPV